MDFKDLEKLEANKQSDQISQMIDEWETKINKADELLQTVEENLSELTKELVELRNTLSNKRQQQIDLENIRRKGLYNVRLLKSEKQTIERAYWRSR